MKESDRSQVGEKSNLCWLLGQRYEAYGPTSNSKIRADKCDVMHMCFPFIEGDSFVKACVITSKQPALTIINSTVSPSTPENRRTIRRRRGLQPGAGQARPRENGRCFNTCQVHRLD